VARVLVVDDDRVNRVLLARILESSHHTVAVAESGEEALEIFSDFQPDIVLLDVVMPGLDGFQTTRIIKQRCGSRHVPVLLLTALSDEQSLVKGISAGADDFISKPVNRVVLNSRLYASLRTHRLFSRLALQHQELQERQDRDVREQEVAARLLEVMQRSEGLEDPRLRAFTIPLARFNGDLLLARHTASGRLRVMLGDFSGHGLQAAIGAMPVATVFQQMTDDGFELSSTLEAINERLRESLPTELFMAVTALEMREDRESVELWNCGMPDVLIRRDGGGTLERVVSHRVPLGIVPWDRMDVGHLIALGARDRIYVFSDGLIEVEREPGDEFGMERVEAALGPDDAHDRFESLIQQRTRFVDGQAEHDDVTLLELSAGDGGNRRSGSVGQCSRVYFELGPDLLRVLDHGSFVEAAVSMLPVDATARSHIGTILAELVSNAVDHGVLGLSSALKKDRGGFARYLDARDAALAALERGRVVVELVVSHVDDGVSVVIRVRDSGSGFTARQQDTRDLPYGRGLRIVDALATRLSFIGTGNVVEAEYVARCAPTSGVRVEVQPAEMSHR
jgi:CheY-like chemotaxis protein